MNPARIVFGLMPLLLVACQSPAPKQKVVRHPVPVVSPAAPPRVPAVTGSTAPDNGAGGESVVAPKEPAPLPVTPQPVRKLADGSQSPAYTGLLASASRSQQAGQLDQAASDIERALRIAPQSASAYQKLAEVRLAQKRYASAEQMARKGLGFAQGRAQQAALWHIISQARAGNGDARGARDADEVSARLLNSSATGQ